MNDNANPRLWVPMLTHYLRRTDGSVHIDLARMAAHIAHIRPQVRGYLIAGSTGDGWNLSRDQFHELLEITIVPDAFDASCRYMIGCLTGNTDAVLSLAETVSQWVAEQPLAGRFVGLTVCPPVGATHPQSEIQRHYEAVLDGVAGPLAVYQLPQVTHCEIDAATLAELAQTGRVSMFKDTSGADRVVNAGFSDPRVFMVRGAEGGYFEALKPEGRYDGLLLSTANGFAAQLNAIVEHSANDNRAAGAELSARLTDTVARIFSRAAEIGGTNPFSDSNRAVDHLAAYGADWRTAPLPLLVDGRSLPLDFIEFTAQQVAAIQPLPERGYLTG